MGVPSRAFAVGLACVVTVMFAILPVRHAGAQDSAAVKQAIADAVAGNSASLSAMLSNNAGNPSALAAITDAIAANATGFTSAASLKSGISLIMGVLNDTGANGTSAAAVQAVRAAMAQSVVAQAKGNDMACIVANSVVVSLSAEGAGGQVGLQAMSTVLNDPANSASLKAMGEITQPGGKLALGAAEAQAALQKILDPAALKSFQDGQAAWNHPYPLAALNVVTGITITLPNPTQVATANGTQS